MEFDYVWGAALDEWERQRPHARVVNLETSITRSEDFEPKGINYRMSPENAACLSAAGIDCCALANNHVLDWRAAGLLDTLDVLHRCGIRTAGAGVDLAEAMAPAVIDIPGEGRLLVLSMACVSSGPPPSWAATANAPGIYFAPSLSENAASLAARQLAGVRRPGDVVIVSIHWGPNWGYEIEESQRRFAHALIERAGVSVVHGHSSHHAKAIEVFQGRLILYGCGDFLNDYEGIEGEEAFRGDLAVMYFADVDPSSSDLRALDMTPLEIRNFRLARPGTHDVDWLQRMLSRESAPFGVHVARGTDQRLTASWTRRDPTRPRQRKGGSS